MIFWRPGNLFCVGQYFVEYRGRGLKRENVLILRSPQSLNSSGTVGITSTDRQNDLADVDTGNGTVRLTPGTTHTSLEPIGSGARQHLVDTDDVEGVGTMSRRDMLAMRPTFVSLPWARWRFRVDIPDSHVETILSGNLDKVLVGANTSGFESLIVPHKKTISLHQHLFLHHLPCAWVVGVLMTYLGRKLLVLVGDQVDAERELVDTSTLTSQIENPDLRVGDTTVEARLRVRLVCLKQFSSVFYSSFAINSSATHSSSSWVLYPLVPFLQPSPISHLPKTNIIVETHSCSSGSNGQGGGPSFRIFGG